MQGWLERISEEEETETESPENPMPVGNGIEDANNMENTWPIAKSEHGEDMEDEKKEVYKTDDPEDAWDNEMQKCWAGYVQRGMKDKGGRMVPNCVPVEKMEDLSEADLVSKSLWGGSFKPKK